MTQNEINYNGQKVIFSTQALLLVENLNKVEKDAFMNWYLNKKGLLISGGDVIDYLKYLKTIGE